jgi:hypothetical protein
MTKNGVSFRDISEQIDRLRSEIKNDLNNLDYKISSNFVRREEFDAKVGPIQRNLNLIAGAFILAVIAAIVKLIFV